MSDITECKLLEAIEAYTKKSGRMPTKICSTFADLQRAEGFCAFVSGHPAGYYHTILGPLEFVLDAHAKDFYVC